MSDRFPSVARLCSRDRTVEEIHKIHTEHLEFYKATNDDCEVISATSCPSWDSFGKTNYNLSIKTYLGWKVYMLHTGCFASIPEFESNEY